MNKRILILAVVAAALTAGLFASMPARAVPPVSWQSTPFDIAVPPGGRLPTKVTAIVGSAIPATRVEVTPSLAPYVASIEPATIPLLPAGSRVTINIVFQVATGTPFGTIDGTLKLRKANGTSTQAQPLPITLTVGNLLYPPDPGEAGKATLEGIDSDGDGVRDDIQRYIALTYPNDGNLRGALMQDALALSGALRDAPSEGAALIHLEAMGKSAECLRFLKGDEEAARVMTELEAEFLNTRERSLAYIQFDSQLGNHVFEFPAKDEVTACNFSVALNGGA